MSSELIETSKVPTYQVEVTNKLLAVLNGDGVPHDIALGSLISLYRSVALAYPCCLAESIEIVGSVLRELIQQREAGPAHRANHH